jgi:hypothetical protein
MHVRKYPLFSYLLFPAVLLLSCSLLNAQTSPAGYAAKWKTVDSLVEEKGLTESALTVVNRIYTLAKGENNVAQMIRSLVYRMNLRASYREDAIESSIKDLEKEVSTARVPYRSILQNMLASIYWNYLQQNSWKYYNRTNTVNFVKSDIKTWTIDDFHRKISDLFLASLEDEKILFNTRLEKYEPILRKGNVRYLRPTLYDLLAHQALSYFMTGEERINKPASVFGIDDSLVFSDAVTFVHPTFRTTDSLSLQFKALQLFRQLIRNHLSDAAPDALVDVDIARIRFAQTISVLDNKDSLYLRALARITDKYSQLPAAAQAWYLQALQHSNGIYNNHILKDANGRPSGTAVLSGNALARSICEKVLAEKDSSRGKTNCQVLLAGILHKQLILQTEKINIPDRPLRSLVSWRNVDKLYLRVVRMDSYGMKLPQIDPSDINFWKRMDSLPVYRSFSQALPATGDYLQHSTEIAIPSLPPGVYALMASDNPAGSPTGGIRAVQYFYVSSIAYINEGRDYFVVNRGSGQPLGGAAVQIWDRVYNSRTRSSDLVRAESYQTDQQGHFLMKEKNRQDFNPRLLEIHAAGDQLFLPDAGIPIYYTPEQNADSGLDKAAFEKKNARAFLFLDRSIYRPGQTLYFKGIVVTKDWESRQSRVMADRPTKVILYDANGGKVDSLELTTNEYGSCHGTFRLPENLLNGQFRIADQEGSGYRYFSIEEYKRPKFFVDYEKQKGSYRVGDSIHVTGNVKGYAGTVIDGAKVRYRVVRKARFPYYWRYWRIGMPSSIAQEIAHGDIKTGSDGKFNLAFMAAPDRHILPSYGPEFEYEVSADVTDINGETRSGLTRITAGYTVLKLAVGVPAGDHLPADSLNDLTVKTTNLDGEPVASAVHVRIYPLRAPDRLIRDRQWTAPDLFVLPEKVFLDSFPHDEYAQETKKESWARGEKVWDTVATMAAGQPVLPVGQGVRSPGWYVVEASATDKYGQEVKDLHFIELYDGRTGKPANPQYAWASAPAQAVQPGEKVRIGAGTSAANVYLIRKTDRGKDQRMNAPGSFTYLPLDKEKKSVEWTVTEADRGGFGVSDVFIKDNRIYTHLSVVRVPWTNKELQIGYATYRDKTEPGSEEKWQVTISGYKKDKVSAEVLAAMYDASLDQFVPHNWSIPPLYPVYTGMGGGWQGWTNFTTVSSQENVFDAVALALYTASYDRLIYGSGYPELFFGNDFPVFGINYMHDMNPDTRINIRGIGSAPLPLAATRMAKDVVEFRDVRYKKDLTGGVTTKSYFNAGEMSADSSRIGGAAGNEANSWPAGPEVQIRKNFNETAFFFPDLRTDSAGNVAFSFTMPEALTRWKWMTLAHSRDASFGYSEKEVITQKKLMVQPNAPRFLREGDRMEFSVKVSNLTDSEMMGQMALQLTDPTTGQTADGWFINRQPNQYFTVAAGQSAVVNFPLDIPYQYNRPLTYRVVAQARNYSDGEEATLPVVSNRMLVTETLPLNMPGDGTRHFTMPKLLQSGSSETLSQHTLTVEFTSNPAWYAVQALPYLADCPYEGAEQTFNRFYANALASKIAASSPRLQQLFARWKTEDTAALLSNLQKNQELKSILLEETPWVLQGKTETEQKKNLALLFDRNRMSTALISALGKLIDKQSPGGGFPWFKGGMDDRFITQYILTGIGHLQKLNALPASLAGKIKEMVKPALFYLDARITEDYDQERKASKRKAGAGPATKAGGAGTGGAVAGKIAGDSRRRIDELQVQYLYMRSLFSDYGISGSAFPAVNYYRKRAQQSWVQSSKYMQGMIALALFRTGDVQTAREIIASLRQNAIRDEEKGMYWKGMEGGYYWYQAPIEIQSLLIEAFREISGDAAIDRDLKTWLLKQKQTHNWPTTKATADACYALLLGGSDWLTAERNIEIRLGDKTIAWTGGGAGADDAGGNKIGGSRRGPAEAGTGYYKKIFDGPFVNPSMGNITVMLRTDTTKGGGPKAGSGAGARSRAGSVVGAGASESPAWGAVYWQYFDNLDQITPPGGSKIPLTLVKKLFIERNTDRGPVLEPLAENGTLKVGDKVKVRIELRSDRDLEYVHMKDMRAACMEPAEVLSQYRWQGGLGYYESTKDVSTDFFFSELRRGTYVFEYVLFAGQAGNFSNGVTTIECMYAPEFAFHSEGIRVNVEGN